MTIEQTEGVKVRVDSEDVLQLLPGQTSIIQECCECGLTHEIKILSRDPLRLQFVNIGHKPDLSEYEITTRLERGDSWP